MISSSYGLARQDQVAGHRDQCGHHGPGLVLVLRQRAAGGCAQVGDRGIHLLANPCPHVVSGGGVFAANVKGEGRDPLRVEVAGVSPWAHSCQANLGRGEIKVAAATVWS